MVQSDITIRIRAIDEASRVITRVSQSISQLSKSTGVVATSMGSFQRKSVMVTRPIQNLNGLLETAGITTKQFEGYLNQNLLAVNKQGQVIDRLNNQVMDNATVVRKATMQTRRFKFEWLSIMFAGMALQRAFGGIVRAQMQLFGVSEMLSSMWTVIMLPVMELIVPLLYKMLEVFMNLPEEAKFGIGVFILLAATLGMIAMIVGQVMLGFAGFALLAGKGAGVGLLLVSLKIIGVVLIGLLLIVVGVWMTFKKKFEGIGLIIMGLGVILLLFIGWWALIPIAVGLAVYLIIKHWSKIKEFFVNIWDYLKKFFIVIWDSIKAFFIAIWEKLKEPIMAFYNFFKPIIDSIKAVFVEAWLLMKEIALLVWDLIALAVRRAVDKIKIIFLPVINWFRQKWEEVKAITIMVWEAIKQFFAPLVDWFKDTIIDPIKQLFVGLWEKVKEIAGFILDKVKGIIDKVGEAISKIADLFRKSRESVSSVRTSLPSRQYGGFIPTTGPYLLHAGEYVVPANKTGGGGGIVLNVTYHIAVSDKAEMERILKENNLKLVEEVKRQIAI